jgi:hypothetical protein
MMTMRVFLHLPLLSLFIHVVVWQQQIATTAAFVNTAVAVVSISKRSATKTNYHRPRPQQQNQQRQYHGAATTTTTTTPATLSSSSSFLQAASADTDNDDHDDDASSFSSILQPGDPIMLIGPGFLQLVLARHLAQAGFKPIVVAPQKKLDSFFTNLLKTGVGSNNDLDGINEQIRNDATIGMPEVGDPYFGELKAVVFCAEEAILPPEFVVRVLDFCDQGQSAFADTGGGGGGGPARVICCLPVDGKIQKERSNSWIPIFNNDKVQQENWNAFANAFQNHPVFAQHDGVGSIIRFGSLFGGSNDGPAWLKDYGLDEGMYKVRQIKLETTKLV